MDKKVVFNVETESKTLFKKRKTEKEEGILLGVYKGDHEFNGVRLCVLVGKNEILEVNPRDVIEITVLTGNLGGKKNG